MESWQVLKRSLAKVGVKKVASRLGLSQSLVYRWAQPTVESADDSSAGSGVTNPLDRLAELIALTADPALTEWVCRQAGGFFVVNPAADRDVNLGVIRRTQEMIQDFSELLEAVSDALANDQAIDAKEATRIRDSWERLKGVGENFTACCEQGLFATAKKPRGKS